MRNARDEFIDLIHDLGKCPMCATITYVAPDLNQPSVTFNLKINYRADEYSRFLQDLDWEYDAGYGCQHVYGTVWFADNTWAERDEYDGSEWWSYKHCPAIPEPCRGESYGNVED